MLTGQAATEEADSQFNPRVFLRAMVYASESYFCHLLNGHRDTCMLSPDLLWGSKEIIWESECFVVFGVGVAAWELLGQPRC